ncbi:uncharacterized protein LOC129254752 [Lytechinus pictus]|uniref:uncharacterized protein LOC129254752 n=1 Tax=Lytechinus pictus TaxID=7653 RepID=UPI0030B9F9AE
MQSTCLNGKHYVSLLFTAAASGTAMPPAIIFNESFPSGVFTRGGPDGCLYGMCDSNFIDSDVILEWFKKIFLRYCPQDRTKANPVLLMLDGHDSHGDPQLLLRAIEEHVIVLERGAPNTQMCQPLDVAVYKSFKSQIEQMVQKEHALGCSRDVKRKKIPQLLKEPIKSAMTVQNITSGFKETGVYPLDPNTVDKKQLIRSRRIPSVDLALPPEFRSKDAAVQVDLSAVSPRKEIPKVSKDPSLDLEGPTEAKEEKDTCKARGPNVKVDYYKHQTTRHQREGKEKNEKIREEMRADKRKRQVMSHTRTERSQREKEESMPVAKKVKRGNLENGKGYINESGRLFSFVNGSISEADVQILVTQREDNEDS